MIGVTTAGEIDGDAVESVEVFLRETLGSPTLRLPPLGDLDYAWDAARGQYSSTLVLRDALSGMPAGISKLLILTDRDLFIPMLSFVYGQAQLGGLVAIVSLARLRQEFYGLPSNRRLLIERLKKETLHEMGHLLGLTHCADRACAMALSTGIEPLDLKESRLCDGCSILAGDALRAVARADAPSGIAEG